MSCAQLRGLGTLVIGNPVFIDHRVVPLSAFANYSCLNTTAGPTIKLQCNNCRFLRDFAYVSWQFIDLPNNPATAVGFQFNLTAKNHDKGKHLSFVSGTLKNASDFDAKPVTYRGVMPNILKFNLFPKMYRNLHNLKLIQPLFHEFLPGSYFGDVSQLQASLESSSNGLINTTLCINFLSSYIVEIDTENILGPVSFLADLGGLRCISIGIFSYFLVQCEYKIKRLRNEDSIMRNIRNRRKAQERWDKLRKYVWYTWGPCSLDDCRSERNVACCSGAMKKSFHQSGSSRRRKPHKSMGGVSFSQKISVPNEKEAEPEHVHSQEVRSCLTEAAINLEKRSSFSNDKPEDSLHENEEHKRYECSICSHSLADIGNLPPVPLCEFRDSSEVSVVDFHKNLQELYEYNVMLREKLEAALWMDHVLVRQGTRPNAQLHK